jgi:hypothetical protein
MGSKSFIESFVAKNFHEYFGIIFDLLMFANPQMVFVMLLLCYAQCCGYSLYIMSPFLGILQHYVKFDTHITTTLERLFGARSFGGFVNHLTHHQGILFAFSNGLDLPYIIQIVAHVEACTFSFLMALTCYPRLSTLRSHPLKV